MLVMSSESRVEIVEIGQLGGEGGVDSEGSEESYVEEAMFGKLERMGRCYESFIARRLYIVTADGGWRVPGSFSFTVSKRNHCTA